MDLGAKADCPFRWNTLLLVGCGVPRQGTAQRFAAQFVAALCADARSDAIRSICRRSARRIGSATDATLIFSMMRAMCLDRALRCLPVIFLTGQGDWSEKWSSSLRFSAHHQNNTAGQTGPAFNQGSYASTNLLWYPAKNVLAGAELLWGKLKQFNGESADDVRVQFPGSTSSSHSRNARQGLGKLTLGYGADSRPFSYKHESGNPAGYGIALCRKIADAAKADLALPALAVDYVPVTRDERPRRVSHHLPIRSRRRSAIPKRREAHWDGVTVFSCG